MCGIIAWSGELPRGLLKRLLVASQVRGKDATGLAFREDDAISLTKVAWPASRFVKQQKPLLLKARRSLVGLAHVRNASPNTGRDSSNAHPFVWGPYVYCHNGFIANWREEKDLLISRAKGDLRLTSQLAGIRVDSQVLGPRLTDCDFSGLAGAYAVAWMRDDKVFAMRHAKELISATVLWSYIGEPEPVPHEVHLFVSTEDILFTALKAADKFLTAEYSTHDLSEGWLYQLTPMGALEVEKIPVGEAIEDAQSSAST